LPLRDECKSRVALIAKLSRETALYVADLDKAAAFV
jgi:hypothetical protein